jgi:hypothetical protein
MQPGRFGYSPGEPTVEGIDEEPEVEQQAGSAHPATSSPEPRWRWRGRRGSAEKRTISILALAESLVAAAVSAYLALRYGTFHLMVGAGLVPLLLLRTPASQALGLGWGPQAISRTFLTIEMLLHMLPDTRSRGLLGSVLVGLFGAAVFLVLMSLGFVFIAITVPVVRFTATLVTFCRTPLQSLAAIPGNWWRIVACVDMTHVPELLPGIDAIIDTEEPRLNFIALLHPWVAIQRMMVRERFKGEFLPRSFRAFMTALFVVIVALPAWLYRWGLKAACLAPALLAGLLRGRG